MPLVVQNSRFLLLVPPVQHPNLASRALALCTQRLAGGWLGAFGHTALVAESFVDPEQFVGTCYKAAGWQCLGPTGGFARDYRDFYLDLDAPKQLWVRSLHPKAREWLSTASLPEALAQQIPEAPPRCTYKSGRRTSPQRPPSVGAAGTIAPPMTLTLP